MITSTQGGGAIDTSTEPNDRNGPVEVKGPYSRVREVLSDCSIYRPGVLTFLPVNGDVPSHTAVSAVEHSHIAVPGDLEAGVVGSLGEGAGIQAGGVVLCAVLSEHTLDPVRVEAGVQGVNDSCGVEC